MKLSKTDLISLAIIVVSFSVAVIAYPSLPERVASHWNAAGNVDGYINRFWGAFLMPCMLAGLFALFKVMPAIDPKAENIEKFRKYFNRFIVSFFIFFFYIYALTLFWNFGGSFNMGRFIIPAFSVLFYQIGILLSHTEPNWSIGIRTPWTLSSEAVWKKIHALGGRLFRVIAIVMLAGVLFPQSGFLLALILIIGVSIFLVVYSYFLYRKENSAIG
jgi:uncharacterized membrane protein